MTTIERAQLVIRETAPRMTPPPVGRQFSDALAQSGRAILQGAVSAAAYLPGGQLLAAAVRGAVLPALGPAMQPRTGPAGSAEVPMAAPTHVAMGTSGAAGVLGNAADPTSGAGGSSASGLNGDDMLAHGQEMSMQMLRLQESIGEENRRYTALSNVLHARHEMAKNAIGNIR